MTELLDALRWDLCEGEFRDALEESLGLRSIGGQLPCSHLSQLLARQLSMRYLAVGIDPGKRLTPIRSCPDLVIPGSRVL